MHTSNVAQSEIILNEIQDEFPINVLVDLTILFVSMDDTYE